MTIEQLIEQAQGEATLVRTITRCDGTEYQGARGYGLATWNGFQVYVISVDRRTSTRRSHFRSTFYIQTAKGWSVVSREMFSTLFAAALDT